MSNQWITFWTQPFIGLVVALGVGLLIGVDRERHKSRGAQGQAQGSAGVRTFALTALLGAIAMLTEQITVVLMFGVGVSFLAGVSYWQSRAEDSGLTTEVALLMVYALGVLATSKPGIAAALGVLVAFILASRTALHEFVIKRLTDREVMDGILLAAAALIILPLLPNHALDPYGVVNPQVIWRITVMVLLINAAGYVAMRNFEGGKGLALAGLLGGFVSSTATIAAMAPRSHTEAMRNGAIAGAALSSVATIVQMALMIYLVNPMLGNQMLPALVIVALVTLGYGLMLARHVEHADANHVLPGRAFELKYAFGFALLLTTVMLAAALLSDRYGNAGAMFAIALAGFADAHATAASAASLAASGDMTHAASVLAILLCVTTNTVSKAVIAFTVGGKVFGSRVGFGLVLMLGSLWLSLVPLLRA